MAWRRAVTALLILSGLLSLGYIGISSYIAEQLVYEAPKAIVKTPASQALRFANVTFPSREDQIMLKGWLIPGVLPDGRLTVDRVIVVRPPGQFSDPAVCAGADAPLRRRVQNILPRS